MKKCTKCGIEKLLSEFSINGLNHLNSWCKPCKAEGNRKRKFGLTGPEALQKFGNRCGICDRILGQRFCIDHDHETGEVRGVLCSKCNTGLGLFDDSITMLQLAVDYLNPL